MFEHHLHLPKIGDTFLDGVSLSDLIWTYVVTGAYCLVQGRVWRFHQRNKACLSPSISLIKLITQVWNHTQICLDPLSTSLVLRRVEGTHKNDRLDPLRSVSNLTTEVGNHTPNCLDSLSSVVKMSTVESNRTVAHNVICYNLRGVMDIPCYSTHPEINALIDCIYHSQTPCRRAPIPCRFTPPGIQGCIVSLPWSRSGAGWLSSEWSPLCRDHAQAAL